MIDINLIRQHPERVKQACADRGIEIDLERLIKVDRQRRQLITEYQRLKAEHNEISQQIAGLSGAKKEEAISRAKEMSERVGELKERVDAEEAKFVALWREIPNLPFSEVPVGDESANRVLHQWGQPKKFKFEPKDHLQLGEELGLINMEQAGKVSGSGFTYLKREAALLQYALVQYAWKAVLPQGFVPVVPPNMVSEKAMQAMGYMERGEEEIYKTVRDNFYLVGTAEQSLGPMHMDEILERENLPLRYAAFSAAYRREAGSYGKDTRGILRVHQFDKLEMFSFAHPDRSKEEQELFLSIEEKLMQGLRLPYQVVRLATGDLGDPSAMTYDIETWMPGQNLYRETHSSSNCTDYQARRLNVRFRDDQGELKFVHTINGTAFAIGRILIAILENYQQADGSVNIPRVLQRYVGKKVIRKR